MTTTNDTNNTANNDTAATLTADEKKTLASCETTIRAGLKSFYNVGRALADIRSGRLYRAAFSTFDAYAADKWDMTRQRATQLIASWRIHEQLQSYGFKVLPTTESQCRPFAKVPEDMEYDSRVVQIWQAVVDSGKPVTAKLVDTVASEILGINKQEAKEDKATDNATSAASASAGPAAEESKGIDREAELLEMLRAAKAKIAYLESALAAEKMAHKRTATSKMGSAPSSKLAKDLYKAGFRAMAKQCHPDFGGNADDMKELNNLKEALGI
jgi:hypothetical protein